MYGSLQDGRTWNLTKKKRGTGHRDRDTDCFWGQRTSGIHNPQCPSIRGVDTCRSVGSSLWLPHPKGKRGIFRYWPPGLVWPQPAWVQVTMGCNMCVVQKPEEQYRVMFQVSFSLSLSLLAYCSTKPFNILLSPPLLLSWYCHSLFTLTPFWYSVCLSAI